MQDLGKRIRESGWRQGCVVPAAVLLESLPDGSSTSDEDHAMVVTQSCDLVHHDPRNEPSAVILLLKSIDAGKPEFMHGRSPRLFHFESLEGTWLEAWAWNQVVLPRATLADRAAKASARLAPGTIRQVLDWLAKRYTRIAFPDGFNAALQPKAKAIGKWLKRHHALYSDLLLRVAPFDELEVGQQYKLACYLLMKASVYDDRNQLAAAIAAAADLEHIFTECGLVVKECSPVSETVLTVAELNQLVRWDYDYLSHRDSSGS